MKQVLALYQVRQAYDGKAALDDTTLTFLLGATIALTLVATPGRQRRQPPGPDVEARS